MALGRRARPWARSAGCAGVLSAAGDGRAGDGRAGDSRGTVAAGSGPEQLWRCSLCVPCAGGRRRGRGACGEPGLTCPRGCGWRRCSKRRWSSCRCPRSWPRRCCGPWRSGAGAALCGTCAAPVSTPGTASLGGPSGTAEGARQCPQRVRAAPRARWPRRRRESCVQPRGSPEGAARRWSRTRSCSASSGRGKGCWCRRPRRSRARVMPRQGPGTGRARGRGRAAGPPWSGGAAGAGSAGRGTPGAAGGVTAALTPPSLPAGRAGQLRGPG